MSTRPSIAESIDDLPPPPLPSLPPPPPNWNTFPSNDVLPPPPVTDTNHLPMPGENASPVKGTGNAGIDITDYSKEEQLRKRFEFLGIRPEESEEYKTLKGGWWLCKYSMNGLILVKYRV